MSKTGVLVSAVAIAPLVGASQVAAETTAFFLIEGKLYRTWFGQGGSTLVGPTGHEPTSLAFSPSGVLYGVDPSADQLLVIDESTGAATVVGDLGFDVAEMESDITFDDAGVLWMSSGFAIYQVDVGSGSAAFMFEADPGGPYPFGWWGLAFVDGVLYGDSCSWYTIDTVTGATEPVVIEEACWTMGMAGDGSSILWYISRSCLPTFCYYRLAAWDTASGQSLGSSLVAANDLATKGVAVRTTAATGIPTLGRSGLVLLALTICAAAIWFIRSRGCG